MKTNPLALRLSRHQRGMALISVLAVLFLLTLLVVAFMARTTGARASAANYRATASTFALADTAVNLVQAQINEATTLGISGGAGTYTWGSQPGAIRVFDNSGNLNSIYRLYSAAPAAAGTARVATALTDLAADLPTSNTWPQYGAQWCDLNAFTLDSRGRYHFPIMDPRDTAADQTALPTTVATLWQPALATTPTIPGFSVNPPNAVGNALNPAPMPVQWLYILKDGSIVSPDTMPGPSNVLTFKNAVNAAGAADVPSVNNPIVGRIAFWTDDDSSKIDINTAAGDDVVRPAPANSLGFINTRQWPAQSTYWAIPMFVGDDDALFAAFEPSNGEFQRYSGHPATVGLNGTLSALLGLTIPLPYNDLFGTGPTNLGLTPRMFGGGTQSATVLTPRDGTAGTPIPFTAQRLYTSVGEMMFRASETTQGTRDKSVFVTDTPNGSEAQANAAVERANFFLTAHSASSELNLFGEPRVSIWPITTARSWPNGTTATEAQSQTPTDLLLAFDSTIAHTNGNPNLFYFRRTDPTSTITDCTIGNNISIFNYLDKLTSSTIPGFGGNFTTDKYPNANGSPQGMHQIIAEIFDYIRTINMLDPLELVRSPNNAPSWTYGQNWGDPRGSVIRGGYGANNAAAEGGNDNANRSGNGSVQVVPSANNGNGVNGWGCQGIAAFPIPVEVTIDFVALGTGQVLAQDGTLAQAVNYVPYAQYKHPNVGSDKIPTYDSITDYYDPKPPNAFLGGGPADNSTAIQAFVYTSFVNPSAIWSGLQPAFAYSMTGLNAISVSTGAGGSIPLHFPGNVSNTATQAGSSTDEQCIVVDQTVVNASNNGFTAAIGAWIFGYIPYCGETGNGFANGGYLAPNNAGTADWNISYANPLATGGTGGVGHKFPFYSQIFALPGQQNWPTKSITTTSLAVTNPNILDVFKFGGTGIKLTMYDAHQDTTLSGFSGGKLIAQTDKVATYTFDFPPNSSPLPIYSSLSDGAGPLDIHILGTVAADTGWTQRFGGGNTYGGVAMANPPVPAPPVEHQYYKVYLNNYGHDVTKSVVLSSTWSDVRDLAMYQVPNTAFAPHPLYSSAGVFQAQNQYAAKNMAFLGNGINTSGVTDPTAWGKLIKQAVYVVGSYDTSAPVVPPLLNGAGILAGAAATSKNAPGDWDNGIGIYADGPYVNMADEGAVTNARDFNYESYGHGTLPYYNYANGALNKVSGSMSFSPNRQVPSPAIFGSLPTGVNLNGPQPWQTLLFRPGAGAGGFGSYHWGEKDQPQAGDPPDHLLLDLFWMPQAEPYPISQTFVTDGKINLNYEIQPFTYITRDTALRALFSSEMIAMMPDTKAPYYKDLQNVHNAQITFHTHIAIDADQTLGLNPARGVNPHAPTAGVGVTDTAQVQAGPDSAPAWYNSSTNTTRFFRSASEICEMFLVPVGYNWSQFTNASSGTHGWYALPGDFALIGDNARERPYADIYSRVTTKSNTYTVYYTVQALKNAEPQTDTAQQTWDETRGGVVGEYRGSTIIERYLDPNETFPDFLGNPTVLTSLEPYYKWRVIETRQFAP